MQNNTTTKHLNQNKMQKDEIVESVINEFRARSERGIKKYGTTLQENELSPLEWLKHLQEELMDAVLYLEKVKQINK
jgi:acetyl-CoA carboxylase alpha subunit